MDVEQKINCKVPFGTLTVPEHCKETIIDILDKKRLTNGKLVEEFESGFAQAMGREYAVAVSSGTDALTIALASLYEVGAVRGKSEVIIPALTFISTANAVMNAGFVPRFVDVDRRTLNINDYKIEKRINENTIAILPVHLMGKPCKIDKIKRIADKHKLFLIEDAAEAHGAKYRRQQVGSFGDMTCYSLYAAHIISSVEGGMITTDNKLLVDVLKSLRNHGLQLSGSDWTFNRVGFNSKMNELEAAVGLANLKEYKYILAKRKFNLQYLSTKFEEFSHYFHFTKEAPRETIGPHAFAIILKEESGAPFTKEDLVNWYNLCGIDNRNLFHCIPTHCKEYYKYIGGNLDNLFFRQRFTEAEYCAKNGTHIGVHQDLTPDQLEYIVTCTREFLMRNT